MRRSDAEPIATAVLCCAADRVLISFGTWLRCVWPMRGYAAKAAWQPPRENFDLSVLCASLACCCALNHVISYCATMCIAFATDPSPGSRPRDEQRQIIFVAAPASSWCPLHNVVVTQMQRSSSTAQCPAAGVAPSCHKFSRDPLCVDPQHYTVKEKTRA
jgi:hypothetical protein